MAQAKPSIDSVFTALGDPVRRGILDRLTRRPLSVSQIAEPLDMTLTGVVQHLQILEKSGLIRSEKVGRVRTCRIAPTGFDLLERWVRDHRSLWESRFDELGRLLDEE